MVMCTWLKGLDLLTFLLERKQKKIKKIDQTIAEVKVEFENYKDTVEFTTLTSQLNRDLTKKDKVQQRKSKKYTRDINDFKNDQAFKWQSQLGQMDPISIFSTPEKTVRIQPQHTNTDPDRNTQNKPYQEPRIRAESLSTQEMTQDM